MRILKFFVALVVTVFLQLGGVWLYPDFTRAIDLFLVLTVLCAMRAPSVFGLLGGLAAGLTADALTAGPFGLFGFANTLAGYTTARISQRLVIQRASQVFLLTAGAALFQQLVLSLLTWLLLDDGPMPDLAWLPAKTILGGLAAFAFVLLAAATRQRRDRRRRGKLERLRL